MTINAILTRIVLWGLAALGVGLCLFGAWVVVARWYKGSLSVSLDRPDYRLGQVIRGELRIKARHVIDYQAVTVTLTCRETTTVQQKDGSDDHVTTLYEDRLVVAGQGQIQRSRELPLRFQLSLPERLGSAPGLGPIDLGKALPPAFATVAGHLVKGRHPPTVEWSIRAVVDATGVDLAKTFRLSVKS